MVYSKGQNLTSHVKEILGRASLGLDLKRKIIIAYKVLPKLKNVISTRRILQEKMQKFNFNL